DPRAGRPLDARQHGLHRVGAVHAVLAGGADPHRPGAAHRPALEPAVVGGADGRRRLPAVREPREHTLGLRRSDSARDRAPRREAGLGCDGAAPPAGRTRRPERRRPRVRDDGGRALPEHVAGIPRRRRECHHGRGGARSARRVDQRWRVGGDRCVRDVGRRRDHGAGELAGGRPGAAAPRRLRRQDRDFADEDRTGADRQRRGGDGRDRGEELEMHPILADRQRLALYLLSWCLLAVLLALVAMEPGRSALAEAMLLTVPPTIVYAFICLAAWYPARAMPLHHTRATTLVPAHLAAAILLALLWLLMFRLWARVLGRTATETVASRSTVFVVTGILLYVLAVAFHYVLVALEREMSVKLLAREAELKVLKAQLDPHFLFNSLNSISALCGSNPQSARTLTTLLAEYLRKSLRIGSAESITLSEELELASSYLAVERIRFGPRLEFEQNIDESV